MSGGEAVSITDAQGPRVALPRLLHLSPSLLQASLEMLWAPWVAGAQGSFLPLPPPVPTLECAVLLPLPESRGGMLGAFPEVSGGENRVLVRYHGRVLHLGQEGSVHPWGFPHMGNISFLHPAVAALVPGILFSLLLAPLKRFLMRRRGTAACQRGAARGGWGGAVALTHLWAVPGAPGSRRSSAALTVQHAATCCVRPALAAQEWVSWLIFTIRVLSLGSRKLIAEGIDFAKTGLFLRPQNRSVAPLCWALCWEAPYLQPKRAERYPCKIYSLL